MRAFSGSAGQRFALGFLLVGAVSLVVTAAPNPASFTIDEAHPSVTYTGGPLAAGNPTPIGGGPPCPAVGGQTPTCESFALTVDLPADFDTRRPKDGLRIDLDGIPSSDMFLNLLNAAGQVIQSSDGNGTQGGEQIALDPVPGKVQYTVRVGNFAGAIPSYTVHIRLVAYTGTTTPPGPCDSTVFGGPDLPCPGNPRYQNFYAPAGTQAISGNGEFNIGFNPLTGRIMNMNAGPIMRITPPEIKPGGAKPYQLSGLPESCPELWEDVSDPRTDVGLDPILWTDSKTGRTFATNSTAGGASLYTDTDGGDPPANDNPNSAWIESNQPPNGGADHEGIGTGPLPASLSALATPANQGQFALFCSQALYAPSECQRSLTLGASWENGFPATTTDCAGIHGHQRIGPDGTAYLPVRHCNVMEGTTIMPRQGGSLSIDSSTSPWSQFIVEKKVADADGPAFTTFQQASGADSSIGIDAANTVYYCYVNNEPTGIEGHVHVAVGKRTGTTMKWIRDTDVGASHGIINAAHTEAIAGSAGRAACGFLGTDKQGDYQAGTYPGMNWYAFIATTYDEGRTWVTVNATPNDPVQHNTGIWQQGGGGVNGNRNLLDFNEITLDDKGRVLYGYSDGCVSAACVAKTAAQNDKRGDMRVARQVGGKPLLAAFDSANDTTASVAPRSPCLLDKTRNHTPFSSRPDDSVAHLKWRAPDNGGEAIVNYDILRGTAHNGPYTLIGSTPDASTSYDDTTSGATPALYYVVRANSSKTGAFSNEVLLTLGTIAADPCVAPGVSILTDPAGDELDAQTTHDVRSLSISEPYRNSATDTLTFTLKMTSLASLPPSTHWAVQFDVGTTTYTARMSTAAPATPQAPVFEYFQGPENTGLPTLSTADAASNYNTDGTITLVVPRSGIGSPAVASQLKNFVVRIVEYAGGGFPNMDAMPDSSTPTGSYTVLGNGACRANLPPFAAIQATPAAGDAPLDVMLNAGTSSDPDTGPPADTIDSYTFDFGDGSSPVTQATPTIAHTYQNQGQYFASVKVHSPRGDLASTNKAEVEIDVTPGTPNVSPVVSAGADFAVDEGDSVMLSAVADDPDHNTPLAYTWTQTSGPAVSLVNDHSATATFTAPNVTADTPLGFHILVQDTRGGHAEDDIVITVRNGTAGAGGGTSGPRNIGNNAVGALLPGALLLLGAAGLARKRRKH